MRLARSVTAVLLAASTACTTAGAHQASPSPTPTPTLSSPSPTATPTPAPATSTPSPTRTTPSSTPTTTTKPRAGGPPPSLKTNRACETPPAASTGGYPRTVTAQAPLDLLVTGDSMQESSGGQLIGYANAKRHVVAGCVIPKYSTGLVRPDYFDWPAYAHTLSSQRDPEAVCFMLGGNDGQNMSVGGRILTAGSSEWAAEYQRRAADVMRTLAAGGRRRVYWIGMPIARSSRLTGIYQVLDGALRRAASGVTGVTYVDIWAMFAPHGHYEDSFANEYGQVQRMRGSDGIHLSTSGAAYLARRLLGLLNADWHLTTA